MENMGERLKLLNTELIGKSDICISRGVLNRFPSVLYKPFHVFGIGLIVCVKGEFSFSVTTEVYKVHEGETVFLSEDTFVWILSASEDLEVRILLYKVAPIRDLLGSLVQQLQLYVKLSPTVYYVWRTHQENSLMGYMDLLESAIDAEGNRFTLNETRLLLISLTYRLCSIFQKKFLPQSGVSQYITDVFLHLIELIDRYYKSERTVGFYADKLCLSPAYLTELSKSVCGYTVHELIFKAIIRGVKSALSGSPSRTVQEISADFHFPNPSTFGTFFKKHTGISPQQFRLKNIGKNK